MAKTKEELIAEIKAFTREHKDECLEVALAFGDYAEGLLAPGLDAEKAQEKFESWAQLRAAGRVFDQTAGEIERQTKFWCAVRDLLIQAVIAIAATKGVKL